MGNGRQNRILEEYDWQSCSKTLYSTELRVTLFIRRETHLEGEMPQIWPAWLSYLGGLVGRAALQYAGCCVFESHPR